MPIKTRTEELNEMLDELDEEIMDQYPEENHAWLHNIIARKVELEIERAKILRS